MNRNKSKKLFYIIADEKENHFGGYLLNMYSDEDSSIIWDTELRKDLIAKFYPDEQVSFYPVILKKTDSNEQYNDVMSLIGDRRINIIALLSFNEPPPQTEVSFPILLIDREFENGVELKPDDCNVIIENFILAGLYGEKNIKEFFDRFRSFDSRIPLSTLCTFSIEIDIKKVLLTEISNCLQKIYRESEQDTGDDTSVELDINIAPTKIKFEKNLPEIFPGTPEDYFFILESGFQISEFTKKKIKIIEELILANSFDIAGNYGRNEWKQTKDYFEKIKNEKQDAIKNYLKSYNKIKTVRNKIIKEIHKISEKIGFPLDINYFSEEIKRFLQKTENGIIEYLKRLIKELSQFEKMRKIWKPYILSPLFGAIILFIPVYIKIKPLLGFIQGLPGKILFVFLILLFLFLLASLGIRWLKLKRQFNKCQKILDELRGITGKETIKGMIEQISTKIMKRKFDVETSGVLARDYENLQFTLDNYTNIFRNYSNLTDLSIQFDFNSVLSIKTEGSITIEQQEKKIREKIEELYEFLWQFPEYDNLQKSFSNIVVNIFKQHIEKFVPQDTDFSLLVNKFNNVINDLYPMFPLKHTKISFLDATTKSTSIIYSKFPGRITKHSGFDWQVVEWPYAYRIVYFGIFPWKNKWNSKD